MVFTVAGSITSSSISCAANIAFVAFMKLLRPTCTMHVCSWPRATIRTTRCLGWLSKKEMDGMTFYKWFWRCAGIFFSECGLGAGWACFLGLNFVLGGYRYNIRVYIFIYIYIYQLLSMFVSCDFIRCIYCPCLFVYSWSFALMSFSRTTLTFNLPKCLNHSKTTMNTKFWFHRSPTQKFNNNRQTTCF